MLRALLGKLETYFLAVKLLEAMFSFYAINSLGFVTSVVSALYVLAISMPVRNAWSPPITNQVKAVIFG